MDFNKTILILFLLSLVGVNLLAVENVRLLSPKEIVKYLGNSDRSIKSKINALQLFTKAGLELNKNDAEALYEIYIKSQDPELCELLFNKIISKISKRHRLFAIQKQFNEEKDFKKKDALLEMLIFGLKQNGESASSSYKKLKDELLKSSIEYQNYYYFTNYERAFALALIAKQVDKFFENVNIKIRKVENADEMEIYLPLLIRFSKIIPTETVDLLKNKMRIISDTDVLLKIKGILLKSSSNIKYHSLKAMNIQKLNTIIGDKKKPIRMRMEAIEIVTEKYKRRLFSGTKKPTATCKQLLNILQDKDEVDQLKLTILARIAKESDVLKKKDALQRNYKLIAKTLSMLNTQNQARLFKFFIFQISDDVLNQKIIVQRLLNILSSKRTSVTLRCSILFLFSQKKIIPNSTILDNILNISKDHPTLSEADKKIIRFSLQLAYKNDLLPTIEKLSADDQKNLKKLYDTAK